MPTSGGTVLTRALKVGYSEITDQEEADLAGGEEREITTVSLQVDALDYGHRDAGPTYMSLDVDTDEYSDTDDLQPGMQPRSWWKRCRNSGICSITLYIWIAVFIVGCLTALIVVGVLVVGPYLKAAGFKGTVCLSEGFQHHQDGTKCSCGKGCSSSYPCVQVLVRYSAGLPNTTQAVLFDNESSLQRKCSYYPPCKSSKMANEKAVRDYEHMYGQPGKKFTCLYNPKNPTEVIRTRRFHLNHVIHGMVWSSLVFILSLVILIVAIRKKGCDFL